MNAKKNRAQRSAVHILRKKSTVIRETRPPLGFCLRHRRVSHMQETESECESKMRVKNTHLHKGLLRKDEPGKDIERDREGGIEKRE